jgi:hypothetical protein
MMVRTAFTPDGEVSKAVIFQDRKWADAFVNFWEVQKTRSTRPELGRLRHRLGRIRNPQSGPSAAASKRIVHLLAQRA